MNRLGRKRGSAAVGAQDREAGAAGWIDRGQALAASLDAGRGRAAKRAGDAPAIYGLVAEASGAAVKAGRAWRGWARCSRPVAPATVGHGRASTPAAEETALCDRLEQLALAHDYGYRRPRAGSGELEGWGVNLKRALRHRRARTVSSA